MFPEAQHQLYSSYLLCFQSHFKIMTCYTSITKNSQINMPSKLIKQLIHSAQIEKEIMLRVRLRTIDSHEVEKVDVLLDSGALVIYRTALGCVKRNYYPKTGAPY